jgi:hypothetical protein
MHTSLKQMAWGERFWGFLNKSVFPRSGPTLALIARIERPKATPLVLSFAIELSVVVLMEDRSRPCNPSAGPPLMLMMSHAPMLMHRAPTAASTGAQPESEDVKHGDALHWRHNDHYRNSACMASLSWRKIDELPAVIEESIQSVSSAVQQLPRPRFPPWKPTEQDPGAQPSTSGRPAASTGQLNNLVTKKGWQPLDEADSLCVEVVPGGRKRVYRTRGPAGMEGFDMVDQGHTYGGQFKQLVKSYLLPQVSELLQGGWVAAGAPGGGGGLVHP